jgi:hypothetical protein
MECWTECPLNKDYFMGMIPHQCYYYAVRAEQDGDSDTNATIPFQCHCNDFIIFALM